MIFSFIKITIFLCSFMASFYALQAIQFERFCDVRKPAKVQALLLLLSFALAYLVGQFLMNFFI